MKAELRPLTSQERRRLKSFIRHRVGGIDEFLVTWLILGGLAALVITFVSSFVGALSAYLPHIVVIVMLISAVMTFRYMQKRSQSAGRQRTLIKEELENGQAEVCTIEIREAIAVKEFEDEGTGFYLSVGNKKVLFLVGQRLDDLAAEKKFPCSRLKMVRSPRSKIPLDYVYAGDYLPPFGTLRPFTEDDFKKERVPCDGDLLEMDFESLKRSVVQHE